jgi:hypothetical protein
VPNLTSSRYHWHQFSYCTVEPLSHNREHLLYCDHVEGAGQELFDFVCRRDLEGIVARRQYDQYPTRWKCSMTKDQKPRVFAVCWTRGIV